MCKIIHTFASKRYLLFLFIFMQGAIMAFYFGRFLHLSITGEEVKIPVSLYNYNEGYCYLDPQDDSENVPEYYNALFKKLYSCSSYRSSYKYHFKEPMTTDLHLIVGDTLNVENRHSLESRNYYLKHNYPAELRVLTDGTSVIVKDLLINGQSIDTFR